MWMKDTHATGLSSTVFHNHMYISNPSVTPEDVILAAAEQLAEALRGYMPQHLQELSLDKLKRLGTILQQTTSKDTLEHIDPPAISANRMAPLQHSLPRLTTKVTENNLIVAYLTASIACPLNPQIPHPGHPQCSP